MRVSKKKFALFLVILAMVVTFFVYPLNYYIMSPGAAYDLTKYVKVEDAKTPTDGSLSMMTVAVSGATPFTYVLAKFSDEKDILKEVLEKQKEIEN